jgi:kynurenine formamidase
MTTVYDENLTREDLLSYLRDQRNWGRWGEDDQKGAVNLVTAAKTIQAARLVRTGLTVTLSREYPKTPGPGNSRPAQHFPLQWRHPPTGGAAGDYYGIAFHRWGSTHVDALCHIWDEEGMWGGRRAEDVFSADGASFGDIDQWRAGIITRGVLLDVPRFRGVDSIEIGRPVHAEELRAVAEHQGVTVEPGDALVVYGGRDAFTAAHPEWNGEEPVRPGLHASCLRFIREHDVAVLAWDFMDEHPCAERYDLPFGVHGAIMSYGVALVDNCYLEELAQVCARLGRYEFMVVLAPLRVVGGTGSPVNPIAVF